MFLNLIFINLHLKWFKGCQFTVVVVPFNTLFKQFWSKYWRHVTLAKVQNTVCISGLGHFVSQHDTSVNIPHPTSQTFHIPNIPHPKHLTSRTFHILYIPYHEYLTSPASHIPNIPNSQHPTSPASPISIIPHAQCASSLAYHIPNIPLLIRQII